MEIYINLGQGIKEDVHLISKHLELKGLSAPTAWWTTPRGNIILVREHCTLHPQEVTPAGQSFHTSTIYKEYCIQEGHKWLHPGDQHKREWA